MSVRDNLLLVLEQISSAEAKAEIPAGTVKLLAVSKTVDASRVEEAIEAGASLLGENYVQEASDKIPLLRENAQWHLIGHLQTNKATKAVELFDVIQSVDSVRLAEKLNAAAAEAGKVQRILLEVNVAGEASKTGAGLSDLPQLLDAVAEAENLQMEGIMGIPPFGVPESELAVHFQKLKSLFDSLPDKNRQILSMGMSGDFELAIREGSNMVRIGTAIFGVRR